ncbi:MAG: hypothetical protein SWX82_19355, partial [Cyanobacteriota bacterium]|nr:hypothetical protein [Cyanobacteriota bacterium]
GWGDGEMGRWGDGEMGRWGDGEIDKYLVMVEDGTFFTDKLWFKADPFKGKKEKKIPLNQSYPFSRRGNIIINY